MQFAPPSLTPRERALAYTEGATTAVFRNLIGGAFTIPLLLALGANPLQIGLLGAAPFVGRVAQAGVSSWAQGMGARKTALLAGTLERLIVVAVAALPFWGGDPAAAAWAAVLLLCCAWSCGEAFNVATSVWLGERTLAGERGRFGARRTLWANGSSVVAILAAGVLAHGFAADRPVAPVSAILLAGCGIGLLGMTTAARIRPLPHPIRVVGPRGIRSAAREALADPRFRSLLRYSVPWGAAVNLSSPFYVTYAVRELGFGILETAALAGLGLAVGVLFLPLWGKLSDRYGNRPVLAGCGFWAALVPLLWVVLGDPSRPHAVFLAEAVSGMAWAGINLATANLVLKLIPEEERVRRVAVFTAVAGVASGIAPVLGGVLVVALAPLGGAVAFKILFAASALLRFAALWQLRGVREPGARTLARSVQVLTRCRPGLATPAGMGTALLWVPIAAEAARRRATDAPAWAGVGGGARGRSG